MPEQREIREPGPLLDPAGRIAAPGFARRPLLRYNPERIALTPFAPLNRLRLKEWDFYATTTPEWSFATAVAHGGLAGVIFAHLIDFQTRTKRERHLVTPLGAGVALPRSSEEGDVRFRRGGVEIDFRVRPERREIHVVWPGFDGAATLDARLVAADAPAHESMVIATPIGAAGFYYNRKTCALPTEGWITIGAERLVPEPALAFTTLDWGRGVWPYRTFWLWASGAGRLRDGRAFGLNLGRGFGDTSAATENAIFVDGRMTKLGDVAFEYDRARPLHRPWRFRDAEGRLDLELRPDLFAVRQRLEAIAIASDLRQITGTYRGYAVTEAGERLDIGGGVVGWAEEHRARW